MPTSKVYAKQILGALDFSNEFRVKKMMGEYCLYFKEVLVGDICDERLLVKRTKTSSELLNELKLVHPYEEARQLMYLVKDLSDKKQLQTLFEGVYSDLRKN